MAVLQQCNLAVPYYGTLHSPQHGLSRIYFIGAIGLVPPTLELKVWNPAIDPSLPHWLAEQSVGLLACSDEDVHEAETFHDCGIRLLCGIDEEPDVLLEKLQYDQFDREVAHEN